jgi:hypothetical protein
MKPVFIIPDRNNWTIPMSETHYYKWLLSQGKKDIHAIETKMEYLSSLGFDLKINQFGEDFEQAEKDLTLLRSVENHYYYMEVLGNGK